MFTEPVGVAPFLVSFCLRLFYLLLFYCSMFLQISLTQIAWICTHEFYFQIVGNRIYGVSCFKIFPDPPPWPSHLWCSNVGLRRAPPLSEFLDPPLYKTHWWWRQELPWCSWVILVLMIHLGNVGRTLLCCIIPQKWAKLWWHGCSHVVCMLPARVGIRWWEHPLLSGEEHRPLLIRRDNPRRSLSSFSLC